MLVRRSQGIHFVFRQSGGFSTMPAVDIVNRENGFIPLNSSKSLDFLRILMFLSNTPPVDSSLKATFQSFKPRKQTHEKEIHAVSG
jgi:hypothetical protein